jgi:hypothetical protein
MTPVKLCRSRRGAGARLCTLQSKERKEEEFRTPRIADAAPKIALARLLSARTMN